MTSSQDIAGLGELVRRLRDVDRNFRVFGSEQHKYQLDGVLSEADLSRFEAAQNVELPLDYRCFLATVGNGGAGPFYGMEPLGTFGRDLSRPFVLTKDTEGLTEEERFRLGDRDEYPGVLEFCHQGCAIYCYLVVNGPTYGTVWGGREDFYPTGLSFSAWYRRWAEGSLLALNNERLVPRLRVSISKADVLAEVGGNWKSRRALNRPIWYFEASDIPAQLELDERDIVVKVRPWPFIAPSRIW
jgi:hypothetical protein